MKKSILTYPVKASIFLLLLVHFILPCTLAAQDFKFTRESVNMRIEKGYFFVSGLYFVQGTPGKYTTISFPIPSGPAFGKIDSIHIYDVTKDIYITPDELNDRAVNFTIKFDESDQYLFQLYYRVKLLGNKAEYPFSLNTEAIENLEQACFYLIAPKSIDARRFSYIPNDTIDAGENLVYFWEMYNFTPTEKMEFRFLNR